MLSESERKRLESLNTTHLQLMKADRQRLTATGEILPLDALDRMSRKHIVGAMRQCQHRFDMYSEERAVLELGPGQGLDRAYLERAFQADYYAIDAVKETATARGCWYGAVEDLDAIVDFDAVEFVYSRHVMEHTVNADKALAAIRKVLSLNGIVGAVTPYLFPDPEPAHTTQLDAEGWTAAYARHGMLVVYAQVHSFRVDELHLIAVRKDWPGLAERP